MRVCRTLQDLVAEIEDGGSGSRYSAPRTERSAFGSKEGEGYTLRRLRQSRNFTQTELARRLGRAQSAVSIMESSEDHLMSTVRSVVEGLAGSIEMVAVFGDERIPLAVPTRPARSSRRAGSPR